MNLGNFDYLNRALLTLLATGNQRRFDMRWYFAGMHCALRNVPAELRSADPTAFGTAACLAGWCQLLGAQTPEEYDTNAFDFGRYWLDLTMGQAIDLFHARWHPAVENVRSGPEYLDALGRITLEKTLAHMQAMRGRFAVAEPALARERESA